MRFLLALAVAALAGVYTTGAVAQAVAYCPPLGVYSPPYTGICPVPWQAGGPAPPSLSVVSEAPSGPREPPRPGADIDDELSGWCAQVEKPSSIVLCANSDLRQMALIRNKIFADARAMLSPDAYKQLTVEQNGWVKTYSSACGVSNDGSAPAQPIAADTIACFRRGAKNRIADLVARLRQQKTDYYPTSLSAVQHGLVDQAVNRRQNEENAERQRQKAERDAQVERERQQQAQDQAEKEEKAKERLHKEALAEAAAALEKKLKDLGYQTEKPIDFELDWRALMTNSQKVALEGSYLSEKDTEVLSIDNPDLPMIRLNTDGATRDARKMMLECRINGVPCKVIVGGSVTPCVMHKGQLNEKELPCLKVENAFKDPMVEQ